MSKIDEDLVKVRKEYEKVIGEIELLEQCDIIKTYHKLVEEGELLKQEKDQLFRDAKIEQYKSCSHLRVCTMIHSDKDYKIQRGYGCIKCGVNSAVLYSPESLLNLEEQAMLSYLNTCVGRHINGLNLNENCDLSLAVGICKGIKKAHPDIDDETLVKYFKRALAHIRNTNITVEREDKRIKRMELRPSFACWYKESIFSKD